MKKSINILLLVLFLFLVSSCMYKELSTDEEIMIAENPVMSVLFLQNKNGYGESNRFIVKIKSNDNLEIREGKLYKNTLNYIKLIEDRNVKLVNYLNNYVFFNDENGLQGIKFTNEEVENDISYNYLQNGFGEIIYHIGTDEFISLFDTEEHKIIEESQNSNLLFVETSIEIDNNNKQSLKKNIYVYYLNGELYFQRDVEIKENEDEINNYATSKKHTNKKISDINNIKKVIVLDTISNSSTIVLTENNDIYSINNETNVVQVLDTFTNILKFERVGNYFYLVENNVVYIYDYNLKLIKSVEYEKPIIGISWYKEREISYIKVAILEGKNNIILERINLENN